MKRRTYLATGGLAIAGLAGCLETGDDGGDGPGTEPSDGTESPSTETGAPEYETTTYQGTVVPLAPIDDVYDWYQDDSAQIVDARSRAQYDDAHIAGAVHSPYPDGLEADDPVAVWSTDERIVTYCVCPHAQAVARAASLIDDGYEAVYALDEGFREWINRGYPIEGTAAIVDAPSYQIRGRSDTEYAGEFVWLVHPATEQREAAPVQSDGSYEMTLHFLDVTPESVVHLEAPDYQHHSSIATLTDGVVTADLA